MVAQHFGIGRAVADYESLLRSDDIDAVKVARDRENLYFYARTVEALANSGVDR